jgi:hypothetical protein
MDTRVAMWELRQGERECGSVMKGRGRTRCRRQGGADRIEWFDRGWEGRMRGGRRGEVRCLRCQVPAMSQTVSAWIMVLLR